MSAEPLSAHPAAVAPKSALRDQEPSMEEILASIRRIIADDQSLPSQIPSRELLEDGDLRGTLATRSAVDLDPPQLAPVRLIHPELLHPEPAPDLDRRSPKLTPSAEPDLSPSRERATEPSAPPVDHSPTNAAPASGLASQVSASFASIAEVPIALRPTEPAARRPIDEAQPSRPIASSTQPSAVDLPVEDDLSEPSVYDDPIGHDPRAAEADDGLSGLLSSATGQSLASSFNILAATRLADNSDELLAMTRDMIRPILKAWLDDNLPSMVERLVRAEIERVSRGGR